MATAAAGCARNDAGAGGDLKADNCVDEAEAEALGWAAAVGRINVCGAGGLYKESKCRRIVRRLRCGTENALYSHDVEDVEAQ